MRVCSERVCVLCARVFCVRLCTFILLFVCFVCLCAFAMCVLCVGCVFSAPCRCAFVCVYVRILCVFRLCLRVFCNVLVGFVCALFALRVLVYVCACLWFVFVHVFGVYLCLVCVVCLYVLCV